MTARDDIAKVLHLKVAVDTDELREWAEKHADAGHHGVAHVLFKAAQEGESLTEQALREARAEALTTAASDVFDTAMPADVARWLEARAATYRKDTP